jgi:predicted AAA+ superfamily ATPase
MDFLNRHITNRIREALSVSPVVYLNGARQTGKSTLARSLATAIGKGDAPAEYLTFDKPTLMAAAAAAPEAFLTGYDNNIIIDEVQLVPELFRALKLVVDEARMVDKQHANGKYLLTGSANILALPKLADALVGRAAVLTLYPFTVAEAIQSPPGGLERIMKMDFGGLNDRGISLIDAISKATFPEVSTLSGDERKIWYDGYISAMLQRDVRQIAELEKLSALPHLLSILAARAGCLMNDSDIARDIDLNHVTTKFYRNILKLMFLSFDVKPWFRNIGKRLAKTPKGYLLDTSMICHLLDYDIHEIAITKPDFFGHLVENFVATEILKQLSNSSINAELHHFRTSDGKEVDFIIEKPDGSVFAIEVKRSESVGIHDFKGILAFHELTGKDFAGGVVLYAGKDAVPFGKNLWAVPISALW